MKLLAGPDLHAAYTNALHETPNGRNLPSHIVQFLVDAWVREYEGKLSFAEVGDLLIDLDTGKRVMSERNIDLIDRVLIHDAINPDFYEEPSWQRSIARDGICAAYALQSPADRERTYIRKEFSSVRQALSEAVEHVPYFLLPEQDRLAKKLAEIEACTDLSFLR